MPNPLRSLSAPDVGLGIFAVLLSFAFMYWCVPAVSPRGIACNLSDAAMFLVMGKDWAEGYLPYVDLWDQKGPLIFAVNAWGYALTGDEMGVFLFEGTAMSVTLCVMTRWLRHFLSPLWTLLTLTVCFVHIAVLTERGDTVGEYALPFLTASFYGLFLWVRRLIKTDVCTLPPLWGWFMGVTVGVCLMLRTTNALALCGGVAFIGIYGLFRGEWRNVLLNAGALLAGILTVVLPFALYFYAHDAFFDFLYGTFLYSIQYAVNSVSAVGQWVWVKGLFLPYFSDAYWLLLLSVVSLLLRRGRWEVPALGICLSFPILFWLANSNGYYNYGLAAVGLQPYLYFVVLTLFKVGGRMKNALFIGALGVFSLSQAMPFLKHKARIAVDAEEMFREERRELARQKRLIDLIPAEDRKAFVGYNIDPTIYWYEHIRPCLPFFSSQDFVMVRGSSVAERIREGIRSGKARYILVCEYPTQIERELTENYSLVASDSVPAVYWKNRIVSKGYPMRLFRWNGLNLRQPQSGERR